MKKLTVSTIEFTELFFLLSFEQTFLVKTKIVMCRDQEEFFVVERYINHIA